MSTLEVNSMSDKAGDAKEQIAKLREQVEMLMRDRVTPVLADAAGRAEDTARYADRRCARAGGGAEQPGAGQPFMSRS